MSTLIEILDYELTENIISPLVFKFDRLIYLYDEHHDDAMKRQSLHHFLTNSIKILRGKYKINNR